MEKGITGSGAGFDAPSMGRLGGRGPVPSHNPPAHQLKNAALKVSLCTHLYALPASQSYTHLAVKACSSTRNKHFAVQR